MSASVRGGNSPGTGSIVTGAAPSATAAAVPGVIVVDNGDTLSNASGGSTASSAKTGRTHRSKGSSKGSKQKSNSSKASREKQRMRFRGPTDLELAIGALDGRSLSADSEAGASSDADGMRGLLLGEPGEIVCPPNNIDFVKPYFVSDSLCKQAQQSDAVLPEEAADGAAARRDLSLDGSLLCGFDDATVDAEYHRYVQRDLRSMLVAIPATAVAILYPALYILSTQDLAGRAVCHFL